jgi:uncharacterized protein YecT (DUF1311 family)
MAARARLAAALATILASSAGAGEGEFVPGPYIEVLAECYGAAATVEGRAACLGEASALCIDEEPRGRTERGQITCIGIEADAWDIVLQGEHQLTAEWARKADAADPPALDLLPRQAALRAAQGAWDAFREAECRLAFVASGAVAAAACQRDMIASRAVALFALRTR